VKLIINTGGDSVMGAARSVAGLLASLLLAGCQATPSPTALVATPEVVVPSGVASTWTAEEVTQKALADIALTERQLGRVLAPARIIRVVPLPPGAEYHVRQLDGSGDMGTGWSFDNPSWTVEAVGTFASFGMPGEDGPVSSAGTHGYFSYVDSGGGNVGDAGGSRGFFPCWFRYPQSADTQLGGFIPMEGTCNPTSGEPGPTVTPTQH
jgi:hypothetical protein